jgi:hypothetical protein
MRDDTEIIACFSFRCTPVVWRHVGVRGEHERIAGLEIPAINASWTSIFPWRHNVHRLVFFTEGSHLLSLVVVLRILNFTF